jgi:phosphatidylinositol-3-phosphatase
MIRRFRSVRLSWPQLIAVAAASGLATALIVVEMTGATNLRAEVVAAMRRRIVVHVHRSSATPGAGAPSASAPSGSAPVGDAVPAAALPVAATTDSSSGAPRSGSPPVTTPTSGTESTTGATGTTSTTAAAAPKISKVKHVFVIALSTTSYLATFSHGSVARYLNRILVPKGTLLSDYRTLGTTELPDYLALISGQAPNPDTRRGCVTYADFPASATPNSQGDLAGEGCVYPNTVLTIGDQVTASGKVWKAYIEDMGNTTCVHPNSGAADDGQLPGAGNQYDTRHNPFIYFHSLLDLGDCSADDGSLDRLAGDLSSASKTPAYTYIAPGLCADSSQQTCPDGEPGGLEAEDAFLRQWVPKILSSPAYKRDGALIVAFASSPSSTTTAGAPNSTPTGPVRTGALVLSRYTAAGHVVATPYGPYSVLRTAEDLLGYTPLAHAASAPSFASAALPGAT